MQPFAICVGLHIFLRYIARKQPRITNIVSSCFRKYMRRNRLLPCGLLLLLIVGNEALFSHNIFGELQAQTLETIAPKAASELRSTVLYFGKPIHIQADIARESNITPNEIKISTKCMGDEPIHAPYSFPFNGISIPGYARKVDVEIYRLPTKSTSATKQTLWSHTYEVQQIPPTFDTTKVVVENAAAKGKSQKNGECSFVIKGMKVDFAKPVDVENGKIVLALVNDLEVADPALEHSQTALQFLTGATVEEKLTSALKPENITVSGFFDSGVFLINASIRGLPKVSLKGKTLRGTIAVKLYVKLQNRRAMRFAVADETILIPCSITF